MFISKILTENDRDYYFIAKPSKKGGVRYVWIRVPLMPGPETPVRAEDVPEPIRERAYDMFEADRLRERTL